MSPSPSARPLLLAAALLALAACTSAPPRAEAPGEAVADAPAPRPRLATGSTARRAEVAVAPASGSLVSGKLAIVPVAGGVRLSGELGGLPPGGTHAIHIHEKGDCSAADATSAGGHFNPAQQPHGRAGSGPHHGGDMDNLVANANGVANVDVQARGVVLGGDAANDVAGRAVIVHAAADDYRTQPTGNAGARLACGVIRVVP